MTARLSREVSSRHPGPLLARVSKIGSELAALMIEHDCGVIVEESFVLKQVDENFLKEA